MPMMAQTLSLELLGEIARSDCLDKDQRWILRTMQKYGPELITMLYRVLGNEADVCDAYQSTFLKLAHYQGLKPRYARAYIFRSASNIAISMLRANMAERRRISRMATANNLSDGCHNELNAHSLVEELRYHITKLPNHFREVIMLRDMAELSYAQVGRILGMSAGTARVYRCKAVQLLAVWMGTDEST